MSGKRLNVPTWEETFMKIAETVSSRSKDPSTQVGAIIVSDDNRVLSLGYNGTPRGFDDDNFPWNEKDKNNPYNKYLFVIHAERNAILNYSGNFSNFKKSKIFVTHFPCNECAKEIVQVGIKELYYKNGYNEDSIETQASRRILNNAGVSVTLIV